ncbi:MAG TPA: hypothetical protein VGP42_13505 [Stellaceae bacterium]|jgi:hypothetical protein|nr:hypothetical protein [Stellaceae bacterium]
MSLQRKAKSRAADARSAKREATRAAKPRRNKYPNDGFAIGPSGAADGSHLSVLAGRKEAK